MYNCVRVTIYSIYNGFGVKAEVTNCTVFATRKEARVPGRRSLEGEAKNFAHIVADHAPTVALPDPGWLNLAFCSFEIIISRASADPSVNFTK